MTGGSKPAALQVWVQSLLAQRQELVNYLEEEGGLVRAGDAEEKTLLELILKQLGALQGPLEESARVCARLVEKMEAGLEKEVLALLVKEEYLEDVALSEVARFFGVGGERDPRPGSDGAVADVQRDGEIYTTREILADQAHTGQIEATLPIRNSWERIAHQRY